MESGKFVQIGDSRFPVPCHACAFFHSREEKYELLLPFTRDGVEAGDRLYHIVNREHVADHRDRLASYGISVDDAESTGQLQICPWEEAYLRDNRFDQNRMLELVEDMLKTGRENGFGITRAWGNMEWALEGMPGVHDIVEYETRLNQFLPNYNGIICCTYDLSRFSAPVVMDIMRTHPQVIVGGVLQENPFYVPPGEFLDELSRRKH